jgi:acetyl/propionyl-CoA carboxylase alpha subunit
VKRADIVETEPGVYSVLADGRSFEARVEGAEVVIGGQGFPFGIEDPRKWKRSDRASGTQGTAVLAAVMPGKIIRLLVAAGDEVAAGQGILVIEAMKMQNEVKAPRDGRVTAINVRENDSVSAGAPLATIE